MAQQYGSLVNQLNAQGVIGQPVPVVGMGVTFLSWSDRAPGTIVNIFNIGKTQYLECQADDYVRVDNNGLSENQKYEYAPNPNGYINVFRVGRNGLWEACYKNQNGRYVKGNGGLRIGQRERYYDFTM